MNQRTINALVFGLIGVMVGIVITGLAGYTESEHFFLAVSVGAILGGIVGSNWSASNQPRSRTTSR